MSIKERPLHRKAHKYYVQESKQCCSKLATCAIDIYQEREEGTVVHCKWMIWKGFATGSQLLMMRERSQGFSLENYEQKQLIGGGIGHTATIRAAVCIEHLCRVESKGAGSRNVWRRETTNRRGAKAARYIER